MATLRCSSTNSCCLSIDDFNQVVIACSRVSSHWEELAPYLDIDRPTVEGIQTDKGGQTTTWCLNRLIAAWLRQPSPIQPKPSWRILCDAVSNIDRPLSEKIWTDHTCGCSLCRGVRGTPVATAVRQKYTTIAAKELSKLFDELLKFLTNEIHRVNVDELRLDISQFFKREEELNDQIEDHLLRIELYPTPKAVLNYFIRHDFIGYINYSLIKVFQQTANSPLLDKHIEEYEKDYQCFLKSSLSHIHDAFQQCPDLRPDYPAGIPKFTIHLQAKWDGKSMLELKEYLKQCFKDRDCVDQLMIADISRNCIIITFAVLPHIARKVLGYLTNDDVIMTMKKEGISVDISKQLMKYEEELETTDSIASMEQTHETLQGLETDPSHSSHTTGILAIKQDWDTAVTDITSAYGTSEGDSETNEYSRLVELKEDVTLKEAVDTYESVVTMLRKRIKSLENQLVTHKQMMMELDNTRESLKQVTLEHDNTRDELEMTKQSMNEIQEELIALRHNLVPRDHDSSTPDEELCKAATNCDIERIETLIKSGANVNTRSSKDYEKHMTPLHLAASSFGQSNVVDVVNLLISHGAEINIKDDLGNTPLHKASDRGHSDVVKTLISHGATINEKNNRGDTPLHACSIHGPDDIIDTLISHGATVNEKNNEGSTPLHVALYTGAFSDAVDPLLSHGAIVNEKDNWDSTPLHAAATNPNATDYDTINVLLSNGAIINSLDENHQTPLHRCLLYESDTAESLISHGADLYHEDKYGNSPVLIATVLGHEDLLLSHGVTKDAISKYRLPEGWEAKRSDERIQYTNTMNGVEQFEHPALTVEDGSAH